MKYCLILFLPWLFDGDRDDTHFSNIFVSESLEWFVIRHDNNISGLAFFDLFIEAYGTSVSWTMNALADGCQLHNEPFSFDTTVCLNKFCHIN
jgi:hypothetical protein